MNHDSLQLIIPDDGHADAVMDYRRAFLAVHPGHVPGAPALAKCESYDLWLQLLELDVHNTDPDRVVATQYIALDSQKRVVGVIQLRHALTPYLSEVGGHIGYSVHPDKEGQGYGTQILGLCLDEAKKLGLERVLVTCDADNLGSGRVIEKNGGILEDIRKTPEGSKKRYWITLS